jgi:hypothetical protein
MVDVTAKVMLMVPVALAELDMAAAEPDIAKVRIAIASVQSTLCELLTAARDSTTAEKN